VSNDSAGRGLYALLGLIIAGGGVGYALGSGILGFLDELRRDIVSHSLCCESYRSFRENTAVQREYWTGVIENLRKELAEQADDVSDNRAELRAIRERLGAKGSQESDR
jgi:uncharacterized coiled-coil protein SlyX